MTKQKQLPMTATACFELIKKSKNVADHNFLNELEKTTKPMLDKAFAIGQEYKIRQLLFTLQVIAKEKTLVDLGFDTYVYRDDVEQFVDMYAETNDSKHIAIIELEKYEREIPDNIAQDVLKLKELGIFDRFLIAYTDYTQKTKKRVKKRARSYYIWYI